LFASLAFDKNDVENQEWIIRRFAVLQDIFRDTPAYQYIVEETRKEERQAYLKDLQDILLNTIQAHFPHLEEQAKAQLKLINDVTVLRNLTKKVSAALTEEEVQHHLLAWKQTTTATDEQQDGAIDKPV
jgi:hypothetical protein